MLKDWRGAYNSGMKKHLQRFSGIERLYGKGSLQRLVVQVEPRSTIGEVLLAVEGTGIDLHSTTIGDEPGGRRLEIVLAGRTAELLVALDRLSRAPGVRTASLDA